MSIEAGHKRLHVAIDGLVASGKGTVTRALSERLGIPCLDTGAIYRGAAIFVRDNGVENFSKIRMDVDIIDGITHVYLKGSDVTAQLRDNALTEWLAVVSTNPEIRAFCTAKAREMAAENDLIAEGRDICNVVLPNARYKFLLTAHIKVRAKRRMDQLIAAGQQITFKECLKQTKKRDKSDSKKGGFKKIRDAIIINSTKMTVDEVVTYMLRYIHNEQRGI